jgi:hypothetical protein
MGTDFTPQNSAPTWPYSWQAAFLTALALQGNATDAAAAAGVDRSLPYQVRRRSPEFAAAWESALVEYASRLEREADRRAVDGIERVRVTSRGDPIMDPRDATGKTVLVERVYSDTLLALRLRALLPEKYRAANEPVPQPAIAAVASVIDIQLPEVRAALRALVEATASSQGDLPAPALLQLDLDARERGVR